MLSHDPRCFDLPNLPASSGRRGSLGLHVDLDLLRLGFLALRNDQRQDAILVIGLDGLGVHGAGKREAAAEGAISALDPQIVFLIHFLLEFACTANRKDVVLDADVQIPGLNVRKVGLDDELVLCLVDVDSGRPGGQVGLVRRAVKGLAEEAIDLALNGRDAAKRFETTKSSSHKITSNSDTVSIIKYECYGVKYNFRGAGTAFNRRIMSRISALGHEAPGCCRLPWESTIFHFCDRSCRVLL